MIRLASPPWSAPPRSLAEAARGADRLLGPYFGVVALLLVIGWLTPIMTIERLIVFVERITILEGVARLWQAGEPFLAAVIVLFSVAFPAVKVLLALWLWYTTDPRAPALQRTLDWLEMLGRWSMVDVFLVALVIVAVQSTLVAEATSHAGLYVFTAAVLLSMLGVRRMRTLAARLPKTTSPGA